MAKEPARIMTEFNQIINRVTVKRQGVAVGRHLAVAQPTRFDDSSVMIFGVMCGRPVVQIRFANTTEGVRDAISVAQWLDEIYGDYFDIWQVKDYGDWDLIRLCQWTVPNGIQIRIAFDKLEQLQAHVEHITVAYINRAYILAKPEVDAWMGFMRPR